jgi:hypothetical protein
MQVPVEPSSAGTVSIHDITRSGAGARTQPGDRGHGARRRRGLGNHRGARGRPAGASRARAGQDQARRPGSAARRGRQGRAGGDPAVRERRPASPTLARARARSRRSCEWPLITSAAGSSAVPPRTPSGWRPERRHLPWRADRLNSNDERITSAVNSLSATWQRCLRSACQDAWQAERAQPARVEAGDRRDLASLASRARSDDQQAVGPPCPANQGRRGRTGPGSAPPARRLLAPPPRPARIHLRPR